MKQVTLHIDEAKYGFFMELINSLNFVEKVEETDGDTKEEIVTNLTQAFKELKLYKQGKLETTSAKDFLNEL